VETEDCPSPYLEGLKAENSQIYETVTAVKTRIGENLAKLTGILQLCKSCWCFCHPRQLIFNSVQFARSNTDQSDFVHLPGCKMRLPLVVLYDSEPLANKPMPAAGQKLTYPKI